MFIYRVLCEISRLESTHATWSLWESQAEELTQALRHDGDTLQVLDTAIQTGTLTESVTASVQDVAKLLSDTRKTNAGSSGGKRITSLQHTRTQVIKLYFHR